MNAAPAGSLTTPSRPAFGTSCQNTISPPPFSNRRSIWSQSSIVKRRRLDAPAKRLHPCCRGIHARHFEIAEQPLRPGRTPHGDHVLAPQLEQEKLRIVSDWNGGPSEQFAVERSAPLHVGRMELGEAERSLGMFHAVLPATNACACT